MRTLTIAGLGLVLLSGCAPTAVFSTRTPAPGATAVPATVAAQPTANTSQRPAVTVEPTSQPAAAGQPASAAQPVVVAQPTAVFEHVAERAAPPEPRVAASQPRGVVAWHDDTLVNDAVVVSTEDLPSLSGDQTYVAWLSGADSTLFLGTLAPGRGGALTLAFASADHANLLGTFDRLNIGRAAPVAAAQQPPDAILTGSLPSQALVHVRHVLVGIPVTPKGIGFGLGLRQETDELLRHAQFMRDALNDRDLPLEKLHAEHIVNLIEGARGEHFGDLNGNGKAENPGDGFGLLANRGQDGYIKGMRDHALLAAGSPDATAEIKLHAGHVDIAGDNTQERVTDLRDRALALFKARTVAETTGNVARILAVAQQTIQGVDLNGDEQIGPVPGEGGVAIAYQHAQLMAGILLTRPTAQALAATPVPAVPTVAAAPTVALAPTLVPTVAPVPTLVPTSAPVPTVVPAVATAAPALVKVAIVDNTFSPPALSVPVGATVVWSHAGQRPHTVTADDNSFATEILKTGATFQHTFSQAGTFLYYCDLHGGSGGVGMSARVDVK